MEEADKLPLKRVEMSLTKFNDVAIPHHLELLRQHKANIVKHEALGQWSAVRAEQSRAARVAAQLRALLLEMDALRARVQAADRARFDALTRRSRDTTLRAIVDYLEPSPRLLPVAASVGSADSVGVLSRDDSEPDLRPGADDGPLVQLQVDTAEVQLEEREALLRGWGELQAELRALHDVWQHAQAAALAQRDQVAAVAANADTAALHVEAARAHLSAAERLRASAGGAACALAGALVGGPLGAVAGAKAGAACALAGSVLGLLAARLLARAPPTQPAPDPHEKQL